MHTGSSSKVVQHGPNTADGQVRLGIALFAAGRLQEAAAAYWRALDIDPHCRDARFRLGNLLVRQRLASAQTSAAPELEAATESEVNVLTCGADQFLATGKLTAALQALIRAAQLTPYSAEIHQRIGSVLWEMDSPEEALVHFDLAVRFQPDAFEAVEHAATLATGLGLVDRGAVYLDIARQLRPSEALAVRQALLLPAVEESIASIAATRDRCEEALDRLMDSEVRIPDPLRTAQLSFFYLAYHGLSNRRIHGKLARFMERACPELAWVAPHVAEPRKAGSRIKVGFISRFMRDHSIGRTTRGLVAELSREQFEVSVIHLPPEPTDTIGLSIREHADNLLTVETSLETARQQIAALNLDVLFYQDIGMEPFGYYLAHSRLARVQCVSYGHPDTTGIPNVDYFVSNNLYELPEATEHYSEKPFLLRDLPTLAYYYRPPAPERTAARTTFGLSDAEHLYLCPQTLFKMHPDFDLLMAGILRRDPSGRILLIRGHCEQWCIKLKERFRRSIPDVAGRISFISEQPRPAYMQLVAMSDVVLDTLHFNGMNTSLEAFAVGTPVVTLPTTLQRGRHTQAMYRKMNLTECVAESAEDYIDIAVRIGTDPGYRRDLKKNITERNVALFEQHSVVREFERFFTTALQNLGA
jgi:protein O-GlcNAc transferase